MAKKNSNYSILVDVELQLDNIQRQLDKAAKDMKLDLNTSATKKGLDDISDSAEDVSLTFQAANAIFSKTIDIIANMTEEVYALDGALTEFKKVSDLSGTSLDSYVQKLSIMGSAVARTGKPKCQAPNDGMVNQHLDLFKNQYNLRAYSTTMVA